MTLAWLGTVFLWALAAVAIWTAFWSATLTSWSDSETAQGQLEEAGPLRFWVAVLLIGLTLAMLILGGAFVMDVFAIEYVARHSAETLPWYYQVAAIWGGHEGSFLLWVWLFSGVVWLSARPSFLPNRVLFPLVSVETALLAAYLLFLVYGSNPFALATTALQDGLGLNPLLQDWALILHPPLLYLGYVALVPPFALVMAMLWRSDASADCLRWAQPYALLAWVFLTLGILLGSVWAYYELGWGGWWFWDPVENASLLPWLLATALIHVLPLARRHPRFRAWAQFLVIFAYLLTLIGAFLVRSGILSSVHAFAVDPTRGRLILLFTLWVGVLALGLWGYRTLSARKEPPVPLLSQESSVFFGSIVLWVMALTVLLGTLFPLVMSGLGLGEVSVGAPYFNQVMAPLTALLVALMGLGLMSGYLNGQRLSSLTLIGLSAGGSVLVALGLWLWLPSKAVSALVAALMAVWIWGSVWLHARAWARTRHVIHGRAPIGTWLTHVGFGVLLIGMVLASVMETWREVRMQPGDSVRFEGQRVTFTGLESVTGPNYLATRALIEFKSADGKVRRLTPERRTYIGQTMPVSEVAIDSSWSRDLYVSLGERVPGQADTAWSVRLQSTPFIRAIWGGALLMALGGLIALWQKYARIVVPIRPGTQRHGESE
ncbi:heme lyase CcmF/NrfE family subunit [Thiomicrospira sp. WB1]|uniref:heme lyase CcmF/NrfE family subunit n=1 Tax=Thiomicrospira sp. WB1 TaxID=1685380 RepID=UPI000748F940|nr:heme lyase CcmF/NrfE family subunit [Thiomicrospira sp. WB1]KUJ71733.1 hypothetical protein AVO41_04480 [Thiomicrospira sp. WB1]